MTQQEQDIRFMKMAFDEAKAAASEGEIPVGAVLVCKGMPPMPKCRQSLPPPHIWEANIWTNARFMSPLSPAPCVPAP